MRTPALILAVMLLAAPPAAAQSSLGRVEGRVSDRSGLALPGVTVTLSRDTGTPLVTHTDEVGRFTFDVPHGRYTLTAELLGFVTATRPGLTVGPVALSVDLVLDIGGFKEETVVIAQAPRVFAAAEPTAPATVNHEIIKMAPVLGTRYDAALPLLPGAVRGPDGLISIAGARSWQGTVVVDRMRESDPLTGEASLSLPIAAVENVQVYSPLPPVEAGPATGGVTSVNTKAAVDSYMFDVMGLFPRPRFSSSGTSGIEAWQPNFGFSGPLMRGRAWLSTALEYRYERFQTKTVAGFQDNSLHGYTLFARLDVKPKGAHHVTMRLVVTPDWNRHYGLSAFVPSESVPDLHTTGASAALIDRMALGGNATLDSHFHLKRLSLELSTDNNLPFVIGHDAVTGGFYRTMARDAYRVEGGTTWSKALGNWHGDHLVKVGVAAGYATVSGVELQRPVDYLRSDGTLTRRYEFSGPGAFATSLAEGGMFVQDTWAVRTGLRVDIGARLDANSATGGAVIWPRAVATYDVRPNSTKLSGGVGGFSDKPTLGASAFPDRQSRRETLYDTTGQVVVSSRLFTNRMPSELAIPRSLAWSVQMDQMLPAGWTARAAYRERMGRREYSVQPTVTGTDTGALALTGDAESQSRAFEATAGFRSAHGTHQVYFSYVRSWTDGSLNDLNTITAMLALPQVLADQRAVLPVDTPHRMLAWGMFSLPWRVTVSPHLEIRTGFPYTRIDENWNVVGTRNDSRYPTFVSLDLAVEKAFRLPGKLPARLGLKIFNIAGRNNGREIQRDVERADYGQLYDPIRRQLRGTLEITLNR